MSAVRPSGYSGAREGHILVADTWPSDVGSGEAAVLRGMCSRAPPTALDRSALFAGTMRAATAPERDVAGTTNVGRLPDPNYAPRVRVERLIATGRLMLAAFALLAVWIDRSTPARYAEFTNWLLPTYLGYALVLAMVAWFAPTPAVRFGLPTHALDLALFSLFVYLTEGPASPFFTYFIFAMVAATLRWQARGALWTAAIAVVAFNAVGLYAAEVIRDPNFELNRFFTRSVYLVVLASLLGALGAHEGRRRHEMASLATWPRAAFQEPGALLHEVLGSAARILNAPRVLLAWEETDEPWLYFAALSGAGEFGLWREPPERYDPLVAESLASESFLSPDARRPHAAVLRASATGPPEWRGAPVHPELQSRFSMKAVLCTRVRGQCTNGRLFSLDKRSLTADDLLLGEIVASHLAASLDHHLLSRRLGQAAAAAERVRLSRDLHDGVLQSLTGAALKLKTVQRLWETHQQTAPERLSEIQRLIAEEQRSLRFFIRDSTLGSAGASFGDPSLDGRLRELVGRLESVWGLQVEMLLDDLGTGIADGLAYEICHIVQEALVNVARHAGASQVNVALRRQEGQVHITVADNGHGFAFRGHYDHAKLNSLQLGPVMLKQRVESLGGKLELDSTSDGAHLEITLPCRSEDALI